jgi:AcrR family transcriptional regulator
LTWRRADIAPRTFHRYFPDKVELLFAGDQELRETVRLALQQEPPGVDPVMVVQSVLTAVGERLAGKHAELVIRHQLLTEVPALRDRDLAKRAATEELVAETSLKGSASTSTTMWGPAGGLASPSQRSRPDTKRGWPRGVTCRHISIRPLACSITPRPGRFPSPRYG